MNLQIYFFGISSIISLFNNGFGMVEGFSPIVPFFKGAYRYTIVDSTVSMLNSRQMKMVMQAKRNNIRYNRSSSARNNTKTELDIPSVNSFPSDIESNDVNETLDEKYAGVVEHSDTICRIVASADCKITQLTSTRNELLGIIDAISHAKLHGDTQNQIDYLESVHKSQKQRKSPTNVFFDEQREEDAVSNLRNNLENSGFQLLTNRDLELCKALNAGYLLRLSILPDVSQCDPFIGREFYPELYSEPDESIDDNEEESETSNDTEALLFDGRILVYRRGYSEEITKGRLLLPKFDYLQSSLVQRTASNFARQIGVVERMITEWVSEVVSNFVQVFQNKVQSLVKELPENVQPILNSTINDFDERKCKTKNKRKKLKLGRYGNAKFVDSPDNLDSLSPFLVCEVDDEDSIESSVMDVEQDMYSGLKSGILACQYDMNELKDDSKSNTESEVKEIQLLKRVSISNLVDFYSKGGRRRLIKSLFGDAELVEPTYEEVILVWRPLLPKPKVKKEIKLPKLIYDVAEIFEVENRLPEKPKQDTKPKLLPLEIRAFDRVPMANLLAVFPKTKLIFRPADAFIFDLVNVSTFLAVLSSVKFDSPKLDLLALITVTLWILRTFFRYSNKLARYDLLVNKFLTSRISHRNTGAFRYVANEAAIQRARRASLVYEWLVDYVADKSPGTMITRDQIIRNGLTGVNKILNMDQRVQVDLEAALKDLVELDLISFSNDDSAALIELKSGLSAKDSLTFVWNKLFETIIN